jgi:4-amino-4-deoxychorismate lyase
LIKQALAGAADASVGVMMFASPGASTALISPHILVGASDPVPEKPLPAWRLQSTEFVRNLPHLKHSSTIGLTFHQRRAAAAGFDDALFVDEQGNVSEGSSWNIAFWDGARVVWPAADQLEGVTKQLLVTALRRLDVPTVERPVHRREIASFTGAVATNSHRPDQPIGAIDQIELTDNSALVDILRAAWDHVSWDVV